MPFRNVRPCLVAIALATLAGGDAAAQIGSPIHTGTWIVGGTAALTHTTQSGSDSFTQFSLQPTGLRFVSSRVALGGAAAFGIQSISNGSLTEYGIGPSGRLFLGDTASRTLPFISASVIPEWTRDHQDGIGGGPALDATEHALSLDGSLGITQVIATNVGLTGEAFYTHLSTGSGTVSATQNEYGARFGFTIFVP